MLAPLCALSVLLNARAEIGAPRGEQADALVCRIWLAGHYQGEADEEVASLARKLWAHFGCALPPQTFAMELGVLLGHADAKIRAAAAAAISAALERYPHLMVWRACEEWHV